MWPFVNYKQMGFVTPEKPTAEPKPPRGFRFATHPPDIAQLIHEDNFHTYRRARYGEVILFLHSYMDPSVEGRATVVSWMNSDDRRAKVVSGGKPVPGIYVKFDSGNHRWLHANRVFRRENGQLTHT